jgi:hypothetical protein
MPFAIANFVYSSQLSSTDRDFAQPEPMDKVVVVKLLQPTKFAIAIVLWILPGISKMTDRVDLWYALAQ